jgi:hypothetical protein
MTHRYESANDNALKHHSEDSGWRDNVSLVERVSLILSKMSVLLRHPFVIRHIRLP